jgi:hypothetical protein
MLYSERSHYVPILSSVFFDLGQTCGITCYYFEIWKTFQWWKITFSIDLWTSFPTGSSFFACLNNILSASHFQENKNLCGSVLSNTVSSCLYSMNDSALCLSVSACFSVHVVWHGKCITAALLYCHYFLECLWPIQTIQLFFNWSLSYGEFSCVFVFDYQTLSA